MQARRPVGPLADAQLLLDAVVERRQFVGPKGAPASLASPPDACHLSNSCWVARSATFVLMVVVPPTQRPLMIGTGDWVMSEAGIAKRIGHQMSAEACDSQRVKSAGCGVAGLQQPDAAPGLRQLAGDHAAAAPEPTTITSNSSLLMA